MDSAAVAPSPSRRSFAFVLGCFCLIGLFTPTIYQLVTRIWLLDSNYSHGFFVLPISIWLAWLVAKSHPVPDHGNATLGTPLLLAGLTFHLAGVILRFFPIELAGMLFTLYGCAVRVGGWSWAGRFAFPIFFLVFLFPLPLALTTRIAVALQDIIATISGEVVGWFVLSYRRGNSIHLHGVADSMYVGQECSGVRQIMAFVAMGALVAYLGRTGWTRGVFLMLLAIPVGILANVLRVLLMAVGLVYFGPSWLSSWMHDIPAMFTLPIGIGLFFGIVWLITPPETNTNQQLTTNSDTKSAAPGRALSPRRIGSTVAILGIGLLAQLALLGHMMFGPANTYASLREPFAEMPMVLASERVGTRPFVWSLQTIPDEKAIRTKLPFTPLDLSYRRASSNEILANADIYIVHSENGEDRKHHPEICVRDVLQVPEDVGARATLELNNDPNRPVQRFCFQRGPSQTNTFYYWHYTFTPIKQENQTWLQQLHQTFGRSPPSVTVLISTMAPREQWPTIERTLLPQIDAELRAKHLPAEVKMSCERLPIGLAGK